MLLDQILDFSLFFCGTDTVYIPGDDAHIILQLQI